MAHEAVRPAKKSVAKKPVPLGALIDQMFALREKKRELETAVKGIEGETAELEAQIMEAMEAQGVDKMSGVTASVSITTNTVANVTDWDAFWAYIHKMKYGHLIQRRVSDPAYRELLDAGRQVPGVEPFSKRRLNLRTR
jgi:hypothetical protein